MTGEFITINAEERFYLPPQSSKYAVVNSILKGWRVENKVLKIGGDETNITNIQALVWFNDNDDNNQCFIDKESLLTHHHQMRSEYIMDGILQDRYYVQPRGSTPEEKRLENWEGLSGDLWESRLEELINEFGVETRLELSLTPREHGGALSMDGAHFSLKGTHCNGPSFERWFFLQKFLVADISRPYLVKDGFEFTLKFDISPDYQPIQGQIIPAVGLPRNWLWYGAPGTGKSHDLQGHANLIVEREEGDVEADIFRYSFSPATTYGDFVGEYRPKMVYSPPEQEYLDSAGVVLNPPRPGTPSVDYAFVPGIFLRALIRANQIQTPVILVIDEINRGDIYEILGEVFQLMERNDQHQGSYSTSLSHEAMNYLRLNEFNFEGENDESEIKLPPNFYLWGTMNPNDASVQQIDSAFFRRWVTKYIGIDYSGDNDRRNHLLPNDGPLNGWEWGEFRTILNQRLMATDCDEEELIGMWFLKTAELDNWEKFYSKLVFHLANNVLKMRLTENNGIFTENTVRGIMSMCERGENPFVPGHFPSRIDIEGGDDEGEGAENGLVEDENIEPIVVEDENIEDGIVEGRMVEGGDD